MIENSKGLSTVQMIIGLALMGGLLMAAIQLVNTQQRLGRSSSHEFEIIYLSDAIRTLLSNPDNCKASFKGRNARRATITALKQVIFPKQGEKLKRSVNVYETFDVSKQKYGQENIAITSITINKSRDTNLMAGTTSLNIKFDKGQNALDETDRYVTREIKLYVTTSTNLSITSCYTSRGIGLSSSHLPSNQAWVTAANSSNIYYAGGHVAIGEKDFSSELVLGGALQLKSKKYECDDSRDGAIRYNDKKKRLEVCRGEFSSWRTLANNSSESEGTFSSYSLLVSPQQTGQRQSDRIYKICYLKNNASGDGQCSVSGKSDATWSLQGRNISRTTSLTCFMECRN